MSKILYAMITNNCNLNCPHCDIKSDIDDKYDQDKFLEQIQDFDGDVILFGGEPTLHKDRILAAIATGKVTSLSTNLLNLDDELIPLLKNISVATSWNKTRFTPEQYEIWLRNLKGLEINKIPCQIMITMTDDLIEENVHNFMGIVKVWNDNYKAIRSILLEQVVDSRKDEAFYQSVDKWLCKVHKAWKESRIDIKNALLNKLAHWQCDCSQVFTLYPDGNIVSGCPHRSKTYVPTKCLTCELSTNCQPCKLQQHCTYPKKLAQLVENEVATSVIS